MKEIFDENGHLAGFALEALKKGALTEDELLQATSHIAECLYCAEAFSGSFMDSELKKVPSGFADEIMRKLPSAPEENRNNKKLLFYSFRVAVAVCASLAIIFSGFLDFYANAINYTERYPERYAERFNTSEQKLIDYINDINTGLKDFSQKILNMEVSLNETEEE
ncbi:MAG TPA: hypothetical protein GXX20_00855 [Clostridiaceae bacterium]|nr:hypothetical protein [Clostridiaceae bacterium]